MSVLTATVLSYFVVSTTSAEKETELITNTIQDSFSDVSNLTRVCFLTVSGKYVVLDTFSDRPIRVVDVIWLHTLIFTNLSADEYKYYGSR